MSVEKTAESLVAKIRDAQNNTYRHGQRVSVALRELEAGEKQTDWIWYVFPQIYFAHLSCTSKRFAVRIREDLVGLLDAPDVRANLTSAFSLAAAHVANGATIKSIFVHDNRKVRSSAALFAGFLSKHPRADCEELHRAALVLSRAADAEVGPCEATTKFLAGC